MTPMNATPSLHFIWLEVSDLSRSRDFYSETLGLPVQETEGAFVVAPLSNASIYLAPGHPTPGNMYLAIAVADVDLLYQRLLEQGLDISSPIDEGWARYIELNDPDGYRLLLLTPVA